MPQQQPDTEQRRPGLSEAIAVRLEDDARKTHTAREGDEK